MPTNLLSRVQVSILMVASKQIPLKDFGVFLREESWEYIILQAENT